MNSDYQSKYWALEVQTSSNNTDINKLSGSLVTSNIDLNPHQIDAALFALKSPVSQGAILADEVGLGKTIEAGIIMSEYFSRSKKHLLVIAPASLRTQWKNELEEKFNLPAQIIDNTTWQQPRRKKGVSPFDFEGVTIVSYNFVVQGTKDFSLYPWDLVVFDEAHKLRNFYKGDNKTANIIYKTFANTKKLLLTATPIQNSLMDIFSLVSLIDANILGNQDSFIETYMYTERKHQELRQRLQSVLHRTLRKDVLEYIRYTNREAMTVAFEPSPEEEELYNRVSLYIKLHAKFGIQSHARNLVVMMIRKLMSSSTRSNFIISSYHCKGFAFSQRIFCSFLQLFSQLGISPKFSRTSFQSFLIHILKEEANWYFKQDRNIPQSACADSIGSIFILLNLLKSQPYHLPQPNLRQTEQ